MKTKKEKKPEDLIVLYKDGSYEIIPEKNYHYQKSQRYVIVPHITMNIGGGILLKPTELWDFDKVELTMELCARNYDFDDGIGSDWDDDKWMKNPELYENLNSSEKVLSRTTNVYSSIIDAMNALHSIDKLRYITKIYNETDDNGYLYTTIEISYVRIVLKKDKKIISDIDAGAPILLNLKKRVVDTNRIIKGVKPFYNPAKLGDDFVFHMKDHQYDYDLMMKTTHKQRNATGAYLWYLKETHLCYPLESIEYLNLRKDLHRIEIEMLIDPDYHRIPKKATLDDWHQLEESESYWGCSILTLNDASSVFEFSRYVNYFLLTMKIVFDDFVFESDSRKEVYMICKAEIYRKHGYYFAFDERNINPDDFWWNYVYHYLNGLPFM